MPLTSTRIFLSCILIAGIYPYLIQGFSVKNTPAHRPKAIVDGYVSSLDIPDIIVALQKTGFDTSDITSDNSQHDDDDTGHQPSPPTSTTVYRYSFVKATGMLKLIGDNNDNIGEIPPPRWIPIVTDMEHVLISNGWSFLDPDESEPLSAFDVDAANEEGLYRPKWGQEENHGTNHGRLLSQIGYSLQPYTSDQVQTLAANNLKADLTRRVLLEGATDPPKLKKTHNGHDFSGSIDYHKEGIFVCALGGLPLFTTYDLSPTTATSGWLSFVRPISLDHIELVEPNIDALDQRVEVVCARTKCHLGHYFGKSEGYCINASALDFYTIQDKHNPVTRATFQAALPSSFRSLELSFDNKHDSSPGTKLLQEMVNSMADTKTVLLGAGCFWHVEFALRRLPGVGSTKVGYAGGQHPHKELLTYEEVCQGQTGHAEVVQVDFLPHILPPRTLFDCFLALHDPTKTRAHGKHAKGTGQYRSCILVQDNDMMSVAKDAIEDCEMQLGRELSTELRLLSNKHDNGKYFWDAEERHQRHDEKRHLRELSSDISLSNTGEGLSTLGTTEWLRVYGTRRQSIQGSAETLHQEQI